VYAVVPKVISIINLQDPPDKIQTNCLYNTDPLVMLLLSGVTQSTIPVATYPNPFLVEKLKS
jgi:hypothetical protein